MDLLNRGDLAPDFAVVLGVHTHEGGGCGGAIMEATFRFVERDQIGGRVKGDDGLDAIGRGARPWARIVLTGLGGAKEKSQMSTG